MDWMRARVIPLTLPLKIFMPLKAIKNPKATPATKEGMLCAKKQPVRPPKKTMAA